MRIIAGKLGGRTFQSPSGHRTHPMSDKMRGALFNALGDITGLTVLDAFAGSGALSFEAISRGAAQAVAIDNDRRAQMTITENIQKLDVQNVKLIKASAGSWLSTTSEQFDLVLLDPPYDDLQLALISKLAERVNDEGLVVVSLPDAGKLDLAANFELLHCKDYGDGHLVFYRSCNSSQNVVKI